MLKSKENIMMKTLQKYNNFSKKTVITLASICTLSVLAIIGVLISYYMKMGVELKSVTSIPSNNQFEFDFITSAITSKEDMNNYWLILVPLLIVSVTAYGALSYKRWNDVAAFALVLIFPVIMSLGFIVLTNLTSSIKIITEHMESDFCVEAISKDSKFQEIVNIRENVGVYNCQVATDAKTIQDNYYEITKKNSKNIKGAWIIEYKFVGHNEPKLD